MCTNFIIIIIIIIIIYSVQPGGEVGIGFRLRAGHWLSKPARLRKFSPSLNALGAHPPPCSVGTGIFPVSKATGGDNRSAPCSL